MMFYLWETGYFWFFFLIFNPVLKLRKEFLFLFFIDSSLDYCERQFGVG